MVFTFPKTFKGRHGPYGYTRYASYKDWLRDEFAFRCVYCLERERWYPNGQAAFGVDHVQPKGLRGFKKFTNVYKNLVYSCNRCNSRKGTNILLNPRTNPFGVHLQVNTDGSITGLTVEGWDLISTLGLDDSELVELRFHYLDIFTTYQGHNGLNAPAFVERQYARAFGYPNSIPDLTQKAPKGNTKPAGIRSSHFARLRGKPRPIAYFV